MARKRHRKRAWWTALPLWAVAAALVGWGGLQAMEFRRSLMAETQAPAARQQDADSAPQAAVDADTAKAAPVDDGTVDVAAAVTGDEWAKATTPATAPAEGIDDPLGMAEGPAMGLAGKSADELLAAGTNFLDAGKIVEGRAALNAALVALGEDARAEHLREELAALNGGIFLGSAVLADDPAARFVMIEPGDSFLKLGRTYAVPAAFLEAINPGINPRNLKPATGVKIVQGPFHLRVLKHAGRIDLYARDMYVRSFAGQVEEGNYLPAGTYRVAAGSKIEVGQRVWVGIEGVAAGDRDPVSGWLYGTAGPRQGKGVDQVSGVKVADADLVQLYNVLVEGRSLVRVEP